MANRSKLTQADATRIRAMRKGGATLRAIADQFGVSPSHVKAVVDGRIWREAPEGVRPVAEAEAVMRDAIEDYVRSRIHAARKDE